MNQQKKENHQKKSKIQSIINFEELYQEEKKKRQELEYLLDLERIKVKKLLHNNGKSRSKTKYCVHCSSQLRQEKQLQKSQSAEQSSVIDEFKDFSSKLSIHKFNSDGNNFQKTNKQFSNFSEQQSGLKSHIPIIENFLVYGIKDKIIQSFISDGKSGEQFKGQVLFSCRQESKTETHAAKFIFPSGMGIKRISGIKARDRAIELMSYCYTNLKSFVLSFECPDQNIDEPYDKKKLINYLNPQRRMYATCIGIHDYTYSQKDSNKFNMSLGQIIENSSSSTVKSGEIIKSDGYNNSNKDSSFKSIDQQMQKVHDLNIGTTQRVFCIMSYFPFFSFFEELLKNLINNIKIERLAVYKHNENNVKQTIKETDSKFQIERIVSLFNECTSDIIAKKIIFNRNYEIRLINQQKISLLTNWQVAKNYFIQQWIFTILNMFNYETFIQLFTLFMLEDRIVFVCENSHILTYTIELFSHILTKPFKYAFPVINIMSKELEDQFLLTPVPIIYGILKKRKNIQEKNMVEQSDNTYVFLSPEKVEIYYSLDRRQLLDKKPTKLGFLKDKFKDLKKSRKKEQKMTKYEIESVDYSYLASKQQKQLAALIISKTNEYLQEEIVSRLPSVIEIQSIKEKIKQKEENTMKDEHSETIKSVVANVRKNVKEAFVYKFLDTQMMNNYLMRGVL